MAIAVADAEGVHRAYLRVIDRPVPPARKKRRVGAEQNAFGPSDVEGSLEHIPQSQTVVVCHPPVGAGGIEVHIRCEIRDEQRLSEQAGPEMRNDERDSRMIRRERVQIEWIAITNVETAGQPELLAYADR